MVLSKTKNAKPGVRQFQVDYLCTTHSFNLQLWNLWSRVNTKTVYAMHLGTSYRISTCLTTLVIFLIVKAFKESKHVTICSHGILNKNQSIISNKEKRSSRLTIFKAVKLSESFRIRYFSSSSAIFFHSSKHLHGAVIYNS